MKFGVIVFPGSNCDHDAYHVLGKVLGQPVEFIWHQSTDLSSFDAVIVSGGFSFGAVMGLRVGGRDPRVAALLALGLPVKVLPRARFVESITKPKLFIQGELDAFGNAAAIESLLERVPEPKELVVIPGSDHFFAGEIEAVETAVADWAPRAIAS